MKNTLEFKTEDFNVTYDDSRPYFQQIAERANARLREMLDQAPGVYGNPQIPNSWGLSRTGWSDQPMTHQARLVDIREIGKESGE